MNGPLDKLHDFYGPPPPAWAPQTVGWYVLFGIVLLAALLAVLWAIRRWRRDRYRREALRELSLLAPDQFSALLKRTALSVWPREQVASLSGDAWLDFLNETASTRSFRRSPGNHLEEAALRPAALSKDEERDLRQLVAEWIRRHRVSA